MADRDRLTAAQKRAIAALVGGSDYSAAAAAANVSDRTLRRWRNEQVFSQALADGLHEVHELTVRRTVRAATLAVKTLADMAIDKKAPAGARVQAAAAILAHADKSYTQRLLEAKIADMEAMLADIEGG